MPHLRGMFSFAIWDEEKQGILLAYDYFGIKPLYYYDDGQTFRFASQVKALLAGGGIPRQLEPAALVGFYSQASTRQFSQRWRLRKKPRVGHGTAKDQSMRLGWDLVNIPEPNKTK